MYKKIDVSTYYGSVVEYEKYEPEGTSIVLEVSYDSGTSWQKVEPGDELPDLTYGQSLKNVRIDLRASFENENYVEDEGDMPSLYDIKIIFVTADEGAIYWMGEEGTDLINNIEYGQSLSETEVDNTRSHNLKIEGTKGYPFRIRTKEMNFGKPKFEHQLRKVFTEIEASGGDLTIRIYSDGKLKDEEKFNLEESEDVLDPEYIRKEILKTCELDTQGDRVAVELMADGQSLFMLRNLKFELFHRRKI